MPIKRHGCFSWFDLNFEWLGPILYGMLQGPDKPAAVPSWTYTTSYTNIFTFCGTDPLTDVPVYGQSFADPPYGYALAKIDNGIGQPDDPNVEFLFPENLLKGVPYGGDILGWQAYYSGDWHFSSGLCVGNGDDPPGDENYANMGFGGDILAHYKAFEVPPTAEIAGEYASSETYRIIRDRIESKDWDESVYDFMKFVYPTTTILDTEIIRREDGNGFITYSGFDFDNGFVFTKKSLENGTSALFMIRTGEDRIFRYTDEIIAENSLTEEGDTTEFRDVGWLNGLTSMTGVPDSGTSTVFSVYHDPDGWAWESPLAVITGGVGITPISAVNLITTELEIGNPTLKFGIPCECEEGIHNVIVEQKETPVVKLKIYVITETEGLIVFEVANPDFTAVISSDQFNIKIGGYGHFSELLTISKYVP